MAFPRLVPVRQVFPSHALPNVYDAVRTELWNKQIGAQLPGGARIAIGAGSRGISNLPQLIRATADHFKEVGASPFVVPAMGSHGGGTAEGQTEVLAHYGVTEASAGVPIVSSVEVEQVGVTPEGFDVFMDRQAFHSDGAFLVNRVKWHTTFEAPIESGLMKMAAIGLGKLHGASSSHKYAVRAGFGPVIRAVGRYAVESGKILGGLAVLEDAGHATGKVVALRAAEIEVEEEKLLVLVRSWMARILFPEVDILIVDEIGKHISGVGMDSKVVNRHPYGGMNLWPWAAKITRIYVRSLSPESYGNAVGIGMADLISERLFADIDWKITKVNAFTASNLGAIRTPVRAASDREAFDVLSKVVGRGRTEDITAVWIRNTLELSRIVATENLLQGAVPQGLEVAGDAREWAYDDAGNLAGGLEDEPAYQQVMHAGGADVGEASPGAVDGSEAGAVG